MSFDYDRAWRDTTQLMRDNRPLLAAIAGIFFFVPYAVLLVTLPIFAPLPPADADFSTAMAAMQALYTEAWWAIALVMILLVYGTLAMLALLKLRARPTVGEALAIGAAALPAYLLALIVEAMAIELTLLVLNAPARLLGLAALANVSVLVSIVLQFYLFVRLSMTAPVMVLEGVRNPILALRRSWRMTRGVGGRISGFIALLLVAFVVVALILSIFVGALLAVLSGAAARLGDAVFSAAIMSSAFLLLACVLAAIYAQLSRRESAP